MKRRTLVTMLCVAVTAMTGLASGVATATQPTRGAQPSGSSQPTGSAAPAVDGSGLSLYSVSALGTDDVWAVGSSGTPRPVVMHYDGSSWTSTTLPYYDMGLTSVQALAPDNVWAVGFDYAATGTALVLHYDGTSWTRVDAPTQSAPYFILTGVGFVSPDDGYAFGSLSSGERSTDFDDTVMLHWDGTTWSDADPQGQQYEALSAAADDDAWRVGRASDGTTVTQHWDGSAWSTVASPARGNDNDVVGVRTFSPVSAWAAVDGFGAGTYLLHRNGSAWRVTHHEPGNSLLLGIDGSEGHDLWVTGTGGLIEHWNGSAWKTYPSDTEGLLDPTIESVTVISAHDAWAVGYFMTLHHHTGKNHKLLLHWDGTAWTRVMR